MKLGSHAAPRLRLLPRVLLLSFALLTAKMASADATSGGDAKPHTGPPTSYSLRDVTMTLRRTPCFGSCPTYKLTIRGNGDCVLTGLGPSPWTQDYSIPQKDAVSLLNEFYDADFFALGTDYTVSRGMLVGTDGRVRVMRVEETDLPHTLLTLTIADYSKTIEVTSDFGPKILTEIAEHMDRAAEARLRAERQETRLR
jgi:hypothetical protein